MNQNIFDINDIQPFMYIDNSSNLYNSKIACKLNSFIGYRIDKWENIIPNNNDKSSFINSLVFMGEMNINRGIKEVNDVSNKLTNFQYVVDWFNNRSNEYTIYNEHIIQLKKRQRQVDLTELFNMLYQHLHKDSITIVSFNRNEFKSRKHNTFIAHSVLFAKDYNDNLLYIDPLYKSIYNCRTDRENIQNILHKERIISVSVLTAHYSYRKMNDTQYNRNDIHTKDKVIVTNTISTQTDEINTDTNTNVIDTTKSSIINNPFTFPSNVNANAKSNDNSNAKSNANAKSNDNAKSNANSNSKPLNTKNTTNKSPIINNPFTFPSNTTPVNGTDTTKLKNPILMKPFTFSTNTTNINKPENKFGFVFGNNKK